MKIKLLLTITITTLLCFLSLYQTTQATGIEVGPVTLKGLKNKEYLAKGVEELLLTRLSQRGLTPFNAKDVNVETGYVLKCSLSSKTAHGLIIDAELWRKKDLTLHKDSPPIKSFSMDVPNEEGLFQAINGLSNEISQFIQFDQEALALKPVGQGEKSPDLAKLPLKELKGASTEITERTPEKQTKSVEKSSAQHRDYIPDQVADLPPDEDEAMENKIPTQKEKGDNGPMGIFSLFLPHRDTKPIKGKNTPYTNKLIVPTPEEIIMEESQKAAPKPQQHETVAQNRQGTQQNTDIISNEIPTKSTPEGPNTATSPDSKRTPSPSAPAPRWKWF